jgi:hypothetical protein
MSERFSSHGKPGRKKTEVSLVRSSAAEYLTFVAASVVWRPFTPMRASG